MKKTILIIFLLFFGIQSIHECYDGNDLNVYLDASAKMGTSNLIYERTTECPYLYPLSLAFFLKPLLYLPTMVYGLIWYIASMLSLWLCICIVINYYHPQTKFGWKDFFRIEQWPSSVWLSLFVLIPALQNNLLNGQVNLIVLLFCMTGFAFLKGHHYLRAGSCIGMAIALKIFPATLCLFLLLKQYGRVLMFTALSTLFITLLPVVLMGEQLMVEYQGYARFLLQGFFSSESTGDHNGFMFNLSGVLTKYMPFTFSIATPLSLVLLAGGLIAAVFYCKRPIFLFDLFLTVLLLLSPLSGKHHLLYAFPSLYLILDYFLKEKKWLPCALISAAFLGAYYFQSNLLCPILILIMFLRFTTTNKTIRINTEKIVGIRPGFTGAG